MYHGIIQEANWTKEGSYLRPQILKYGFQKNIGKGRIFRLVHDGFTRREKPHMLDETPAQLVNHLSDPNGWWRDTAQKLIILRGDKSVVPALSDLARSDPHGLTRLHALWTLEGLDAITDDLLIEKLKDVDPRLREAAVRIAEPLLGKNHPGVTEAVKDTATDADPTVSAQVCLSEMRSNSPDAGEIVTMATSFNRPTVAGDCVKAIVKSYRDMLAKEEEQKRKDAEIAKADAIKGELYARGREAYGQTCIACHAPDGMGMPAPEHNGTTLAPPLAGSRKLMADPQLVARIVLNGLTGPDNGINYPGQMASFKWADDLWLASILTYARNDWGNKAPAVKPEDIAVIRKLAGDRNKPFTLQELYTATQAAAPVIPTGAKVLGGPDDILLDPTTAELHGNIRIDCYPSGLDIGYWDNSQDWVGWKIPALPAGDYTIITRTCTMDSDSNFAVKIASQQFFGTAARGSAWDEYHDLSVGVIHLEQSGEAVVEFHPRSADHWHPTNLASIRLVPVRH
jgi:mono/diheme cytochrome c family protein